MRSVAIVVCALGFAVTLTGCASVYRLGPGEALVIVDRHAVTCAGAGCQVTRVLR